MLRVRKNSAVLIAAAIVVGSTLVTAPSAMALGTTNQKCTYYDTSTGYSSLSNGGFTTNAGVCGTSKVRLFYQTYNGSPTYYTGWVTSSSTAATGNPGNLVRGGNHGVANPTALYPNAKSYTS